MHNVASGVARARPMPGHSMGTLCLRVALYSMGTTRTQAPPSFSACSTKMQKQLGRSGECSPRKFWEFLSFLGRFCGYFRPYRCLELEHFNHAFAANLPHVQRKVTVVLTANMHTLRSGKHTDLVILKIQIAILHSSISTPLYTFSAQF